MYAGTSRPNVGSSAWAPGAVPDATSQKPTASAPARSDLAMLRLDVKVFRTANSRPWSSHAGSAFPACQWEFELRKSRQDHDQHRVLREDRRVGLVVGFVGDGM